MQQVVVLDIMQLTRSVSVSMARGPKFYLQQPVIASPVVQQKMAIKLYISIFNMLTNILEVLVNRVYLVTSWNYWNYIAHDAGSRGSGCVMKVWLYCLGWSSWSPGLATSRHLASGQRDKSFDELLVRWNCHWVQHQLQSIEVICVLNGSSGTFSFSFFCRAQQTCKYNLQHHKTPCTQ